MNTSLKLVIGSDHAGFAYKQKLIGHLTSLGFEVIDVGCDSEESCHYPIFAHRLCEKILSGDAALGILVCGTGIGMSIAANKHKGIRASVCSDKYSAELTRQHNDANVLCMGARVIDYDMAEALTDIFLDTDFIGGKHATRVELISEIENGTLKE